MESQATPKSTHKAFRTFEDLEVYQMARAFRTTMYAVTRRLPAHEKFELASQIRRAAVSLTNNIAEGHGRYHYLDQIKFTLQARGSLQELIDDLNVCEDERYVPSTEIVAWKQDAWRVYQLINGYIRYLRERKTGTPPVLHESTSAYGLAEEELGPVADEPMERFNDSTIQRT